MKLFYEGELSQYLRQKSQALSSEVHSEPEDKLLNVEKSQYVDYLVAKYTLEAPEFLWDQVTVDQTEKAIPAEHHGFNWNVTPGRSYMRQVLVYEYPFIGQSELFRYRPSTHLMWTDDLKLTGSSVYFEIVNLNLTPDTIKNQAESFRSKLETQSGHVRAEVNSYNERLREHAEAAFDNRKSQLLDQRSLLHELGVPVRKSGSVPKTFAVEAPKRKLVTKPEAPSSAFKPEPTLPTDAYEQILEVIDHVGQEMERHPAVYSGKDEETLRDHLLMSLSPNFESATGETFNRAGKTDILVKHEASNVFVAECTMWNGKGKYLKKIDQALSYLTWRDAKSAIIIFVRNKQLQPVLDTIAEVTPTHPAWTHTETSRGDGSFSYRFHLPDDESRGVDLAVLVFHLPPT